MDSNKESKNWKKIILIGVIATVTPGGFIFLGAYGLKKLMERSKDKDTNGKALKRDND